MHQDVMNARNYRAEQNREQDIIWHCAKFGQFLFTALFARCFFFFFFFTVRWTFPPLKSRISLKLKLKLCIHNKHNTTMSSAYTRTCCLSRPLLVIHPLHAAVFFHFLVPLGFILQITCKSVFTGET